MGVFQELAPSACHFYSSELQKYHFILLRCLSCQSILIWPSIISDIFGIDNNGVGQEDNFFGFLNYLVLANMGMFRGDRRNEND